MCNTFFEHEDKHLVAHESGGHRSPADLLKVDRCLVMNVKVIVGEECVSQSQHCLVLASERETSSTAQSVAAFREAGGN